MQRILPPVLVLILLILMAAATLVVPWPALPTWARALGLIPLAFGVAVTLRHARLFHAVATNIKTFDDPNILVRTGAFTWTRNPMYLGFTVFLIGVAALVGSAIAWIGPILFFVAADRWYIPFEERRLTATFGSDYDTYQRQVRRWVGQHS